MGSRSGLIAWLAAIAIVAAAAPAAAESHIGRWAIKQEGCRGFGISASTTPLIVTQTSLQWFMSSCRIGKIYKTGQAVYIQAHCSSEGRMDTIPITLAPRATGFL
jgi:hypothetical protein